MEQTQTISKGVINMGVEIGYIRVENYLGACYKKVE